MTVNFSHESETPKIYNLLYFDSTAVVIQDNKIVVTPNFLCPKCGDQTKPSTRPQSKLHAPEISVSIEEDTNNNQLVVFTMPCCGTKISLYVAVHKMKDEKQPQISISTLPITVDWRKRPDIKEVKAP